MEGGGRAQRWQSAREWSGGATETCQTRLEETRMTNDKGGWKGATGVTDGEKGWGGDTRQM